MDSTVSDNIGSKGLEQDSAKSKGKGKGKGKHLGKGAGKGQRPEKLDEAVWKAL